MKRCLSVGGAAALSVGLGVLVPVLHERLARRELTELGLAVAGLGGLLVLTGIVAGGIGLRWKAASSLPGIVRVAVFGNVLFLGLFALEISDGLVRRGGNIPLISSTLFVPAAMLLYGLASARGWAWWTARGVAVLAAAWFLGFMVLIPFVDLRADGVPIPWYGRAYMIGVSLVLASILAGGFWSLGRAEAKAYFGLNRILRSQI